LPFILSVFLKRSSKSWFDYHLTKSFGSLLRTAIPRRSQSDQSITISAFVLSAKANAIANFGLFGLEILQLENRRLEQLVRERYER
jgi:hypothetical protein